MRNFQQKSKFRKIMETKPALFVFGIIILIFSWNIFILVNKMQDTNSNKKQANQRILELEEAKRELYSNIEELNTEKGKEENIREKFGWAKEGETMVVVVEENKESTLAEENNSNNFFKRIINIFR